MQVNRPSGGISPLFSAEWVDAKGNLAADVKGLNHGPGCACVAPMLFDSTPAHQARVRESAPATLQAGISATLGYDFDYDAAAAGIRASMAAYVGADTSNPPGNEARVVDMIAARLAKAGIEAKVTEVAPGRKNLVATLKGSGEEKALVLMAHTDVVPTDGQVWTTPPHVLTEKDGYLYGRGTRDDLSMVAANLELFLMLAAAKVPLKRDIVLACTCDEEFHSTGVIDLLKTSPELAQAGLVINEGASVVNSGPNTPAFYVGYELAQKTAQDFIVSTKGKPGHSAFPVPGNAIARLGKAVGKLGDTMRPARVTDVTRAYFKARAGIEADPKLRDAMRAIADAKGEPPADAVAVIDASPQLSPLLRTTFAPTLISGGLKNNVLPSSATANINARIMPDESIDDAEAWLKSLFNDNEVTITRAPANGSGPASPLEGPFVDALRTATKSMWPNTPLIPTFGVGYTDSRFFRGLGVAAYGFSPFPGAAADLLSIHAGDERIQAAALRPGIELYTKLVLQLAAQPRHR